MTKQSWKYTPNFENCITFLSSPPEAEDPKNQGLCLSSHFSIFFLQPSLLELPCVAQCSFEQKVVWSVFLEHPRMSVT